jgi:hypothetical protein
MTRTATVATATSSSVFSPSSSALAAESRRSYVHAFVRYPNKAAIPTFATHRFCPMRGTVPDKDMNSVEIDRDLFEQQFDIMHKVLMDSSLVDSTHVLPQLPHFESIKVSDLMTSMAEAMLPMPLSGMEHRTSELTETVRFIRTLGSSGTTVDLLQQDERCRAVGSDFVLLPNGFVAAITPRTNSYAIAVMQGSYAVKEETKVFPTVAANLKDMQLPVQDICGFAGQHTIIVWDTPEGQALTEAISQKASRPWQFVKVEPGFYFLSFSGGIARYDIICDADFPKSTERLQKAGLRVVPIDWSEPKKLGLGMRPCVLVLLFARGGFSGGGMANHERFRKGRGDDKMRAKNNNGQKRSGAEGAPLYAQLLGNELPPPVYQPPPRYVAPMHRPNVPAVYDQEQADETYRQYLESKTHIERTGGFDHTKVGPEKFQTSDEQEDGRRFRPGWEFK